jgi:minichromosome maintenance protein 10
LAISNERLAVADKKIGPTADQPWPPRSPLQALLSSPSGRKRYESRGQRDSVSPSPAKRRRINDQSGSPSRPHSTNRTEDSEDEDEDEETLNLKLQAIEAKLKLKKLQKAKEKASNILDNSSEPPTSRPGTATSFHKNEISATSKIHVPLSPIRTTKAPEPVSPARVILGIDKGLRAKDVSLKRAAGSRTPAANRSTTTQSLQLSRSNSVNSSSRVGKEGLFAKPMNFTERMLEARNAHTDEIAKQERINQARNQGFGLSDSKNQSVTSSSQTLPVSATHRHGSSESTSELQSRPTSRSSQLIRSASRTEQTEEKTSNEDPILEPYSGFHMRNRRTDHNTLTRMFSGKEMYSIPRLLKEVKSPGYDPPDCESDYVVLGIIANKSAPLEHKNRFPKVVHSAGSEESSTHSKFMVMRLTDLKWELDLFLFDTGFETFWKLTPGTVVAILNPAIMPPRDRNTGAFSLKLSSSEDTLLEIGTATDLGFCKANRANGSECLAWVDGRKTEFCEYHISLKVDKARKGRMQFNTMIGGKTVSSKRGRGRGSGRGRTFGFHDKGLISEGRTYDRSIHETIYLAPQEFGFNATRLLDDNDADVNAWQRGCSREEWERKKQKERDKEAELARKLGEMGSGAGRAYLLARGTASGESSSAAAIANGRASSLRPPSSSASTLAPTPADAQSLGLLGKRAQDVSFAAAGNKRKRGFGCDPVSEPMGWGGAGKRGLLFEDQKVFDAKLPVKSTLKEPGQTSPKKNARFEIEGKGIRLPGRDSLGGAVEAGRRKIELDSDDDLEIV